MLKFIYSTKGTELLTRLRLELSHPLLSCRSEIKTTTWSCFANQSKLEPGNLQ